MSMHYWRCINRLDYADKFCSNSVGFEENALKDSVCRALSSFVRERANGMELVKSHLVYVASSDDKSDDLYFIDKAINDEEQHIVELASLAIKSPNNRDNYEAAKAEIQRIENYLTED